MKKFYKKISFYTFICLSPFILVLSRYIYLDVYCDFKIDKNYSLKFWFNSLGDFSTKKLIRNKDLTRNTFIFGSSRSTHLYGCYIQKQLFNKNISIKPYFFGNYGETIGGIEKKINLLDSLEYKIQNIIMIIDPDMAFELNGDVQKYDYYSFLNRSKFENYIYHFNAFFSNEHKDLKEKIKIMLGLPIPDSLIYTYKSDPITNDQGHQCNNFKPYSDSNNILKKFNSKKHINKIMNSKDYKIKIPEKDKISIKEVQFLQSISRIIKKHKSNYVIIISPLLSKEQLSIKDLEILYKLFGKQHILNLAGANKITKNPANFKDSKHFNNIISKLIIDSIQKLNILTSSH